MKHILLASLIVAIASVAMLACSSDEAEVVEKT